MLVLMALILTATGVIFNCYLQLVTWLGTDETKRNTAEPAMYISILMFILYSNNNNNNTK